MASAHKPCPICEENAVLMVFSSPECKNCGYKWTNITQYRDMYIGRTRPAARVMPKPIKWETLEEVDETADNYVTSGDMKKDVEAVIETAILENEFMVVKRIGARVAEIVTAGIDAGEKPDMVLDRVLIQITQEIKDSMAKKDGTWDGE